MKQLMLLLFFSNCILAQQPKLMLPIGHTDYVSSVQFSPDGKNIVTASSDNTAKIWDVVTGNLIADLKGHSGVVNSAQFSTDGKKIITASNDSTAKIWDVATGNLVVDLKGHSKRVNQAQFSPDGKKIVTGSWDSSAKIWDAATGNLILDLKGHTGEVDSAQFSPDGKYIVTASVDATAKIWDAASGNLVANLIGHTAWVYSAQYSPDGKKIATASNDETAKIWDAFTGKLIVDLKGHSGSVNSVQFSPDVKRIGTASSDKTAKIWDVYTGNLISDLEGHTDRAFSIQFSPDGKKIVTVAYDDTAKIWDAFTGKFIADLKGHKSPVTLAEFSFDGKKIATGSLDNTIKIWDAVTGNLLVDLKGHTKGVASAQFSRDGKKISTAQGITVKIWDVNKGNAIAHLKGHTSKVESVQFSPDEKIIVTGSKDNTAKIWDSNTGKVIVDLKGHTKPIYVTQFSGDGKNIVTGSWDKTAKVWDVATGNLMADLKGNVGLVCSVQFSPDGKKIVSATSGNLSNNAKIWDAFNGNLIVVLKGHSGSVNSVQFSPDGKQIVTGSWDKTAKIWDADAGDLLIDLIGHSGSVNTVLFNADGKQIVTASDDHTAKIWETATGKLIANFKGHTEGVEAVQFSPDETKIVTASYDNTAKIWDARTGNLIADLKGHTGKVRSAQFSSDGKKIVTGSDDTTSKIWNAETGELLYTFFAVDDSDYLIVDKFNHYDGTEGARKLLYFTCGTEIIELDQVKDQLWVPNLAERIMKGETINAKTLDELNICDLTPVVEKVSSNPDQYYFKIKPGRGGLGETVLLVNGIEAKRYKLETLKKNADVYDLIIDKSELKNLFIAGKENPVTVKAYTSDNTISSRGLKLVENKTKETISPPNLYAVMIGVSDYKGEGIDLKYAAKDATDLSMAVANAAKKLLNTDSKEHVFMYNLTTAEEHYQLPEKKSIKKVLEEIGKKATANDILFLFFAGHGVMTGEADKKQFYFLTADASQSSFAGAVADVGVSTAELTEWMKPQNIKAQKRILIFDACNSGQAINDFVKMGTDDQNYIAGRNDDKVQQIKAIDKLNEKSGLFILSASASNQSAYEMGRYAQGLLTYSLLKAIKQQPDILDNGKYLDVSRWFNAAEKSVSEIAKENGARQEPQIVSNTNFNIGLVDEEVMAKIVLPLEKPLFASSNFQNSDEAIADDDLELSKMINTQLNNLAARGTDSKIVYVTATNSPDAYSLSGRYLISGNAVKVSVNIKQSKTLKLKFEWSGTKDKLEELAAAIAEKAFEKVK